MSQVAKSATDVGRLGALGADLSRQYGQLASDATGAAAATSNADVSTRIRSGVQELGRACLELVKAGGACQMAPQGDTFAQRDVADSARHVSEKVLIIDLSVHTNYIYFRILFNAERFWGLIRVFSVF
jgi:talin